ncbi:MAG: thiamine phosphate synthase [Nitrospiraceae bacterium]
MDATRPASRTDALKGLYLLLDPSVRPDRPLTDVLKAAADQGVRLFQYRDKRATMRDAYRQAQALRRAAEETGSLLIINDRCDLAIAVDADGVHVGQDDLPVEQARKLVGPGKLVGLSTHNAEQVMAATSAAPDYIGFGPIFSTSTKADHDPLVGINGLRQARELTTLPIFAIGGLR